MNIVIGKRTINTDHITTTEFGDVRDTISGGSSACLQINTVDGKHFNLYDEDAIKMRSLLIATCVYLDKAVDDLYSDLANLAENS